MTREAAGNGNIHEAIQGRIMFWSNVNVFIACFFLLAMFAAGPLFVVLSILLSSFAKFASTAPQLIYPVIYLLFALPLLFFWWKTNLTPATRNPGRERRYRIGHGLVGLMNVATILAFSVPFVLARFSGNPNLVMYGWFALPIYALAPLVWIIGLFMIWSSSA